jgi:hypothetical protein
MFCKGYEVWKRLLQESVKVELHHISDDSINSSQRNILVRGPRRKHDGIASLDKACLRKKRDTEERLGPGETSGNCSGKKQGTGRERGDQPVIWEAFSLPHARQCHHAFFSVP